MSLESGRRDDSDNGGVDRRPGTMVGTGIAIGAGFGVALGVAFDNIALGIAVGAAIGSAIGAALEQSGGTLETAAIEGRGRRALVLALFGLLVLGILAAFTVFLISR